MLLVGKLYKVFEFKRHAVFSTTIGNKIVLVASATEEEIDFGHPLRRVSEHYEFLCEEKLYTYSIQQYVKYDSETHNLELFAPGECADLKTAIYCNDTSTFVLVPERLDSIFTLIENNA